MSELDQALTSKPTYEDLERRIDEMGQQLASAQQKGENQTVDTSDGPKTVPQLRTEHQIYMEQANLEVLRSQRFRQEQEARSPVAHLLPGGELTWRSPTEANAPLFPDGNAVSTLVGLKKFGTLTPLERAQARDIRPSDLREHKVDTYFGPNTSAAAIELSKKNYPLYKALKQEAIKRGIIG